MGTEDADVVVVVVVVTVVAGIVDVGDTPCTMQRF